MVVVVWAGVGRGGSFFPRIRGFGERFDESLPACAFFSFFFLSGNQLALSNVILSAGISPQWLSDLRRLWTTVFRRVASEPVSLIQSYTMPG